MQVPAWRTNAPSQQLSFSCPSQQTPAPVVERVTTHQQQRSYYYSGPYPAYDNQQQRALDQYQQTANTLGQSPGKKLVDLYA